MLFSLQLVHNKKLEISVIRSLFLGLLRTLLSLWSCPKSMAIVVSLSGRPDNSCWLQIIIGDQCLTHYVRAIGTFVIFKASPWWPRITKAPFFTVTLGTWYRKQFRFTSLLSNCTDSTLVYNNKRVINIWSLHCILVHTIWWAKIWLICIFIFHQTKRYRYILRKPHVSSSPPLTCFDPANPN